MLHATVALRPCVPATARSDPQKWRSDDEPFKGVCPLLTTSSYCKYSGKGIFSSLPSFVLPVARPSMSFSRLSFLWRLVELFSKGFVVLSFSCLFFAKFKLIERR